ncbi:MAG: zinc-ribbon domain-containing protein [Oscillospiraceae bacterium]|nr:zinc-ribbon domain-containing protein [Oscillospiraceae bacterium]
MAALLDNLMELYPAVAAEWDYEQNGSLRPETVVYSSGLVVAWRCSAGHKWEEAVYLRCKGAECPVCRQMQKCLAGRFPHLAAEWHTEKNGPLTDQVKASSKEKVWWRCEKGHEWPASIYSRAYKKARCPLCRKAGKG